MTAENSSQADVKPPRLYQLKRVNQILSNCNGEESLSPEERATLVVIQRKIDKLTDSDPQEGERHAEFPGPDGKVLSLGFETGDVTDDEGNLRGNLPRKEAKLLALFLGSPNTAFSTQDIRNHLYPHDLPIEKTDKQRVYILVGRLRKSLDLIAGTGDSLINIPHKGYAFVTEPEETHY